MTTPQAYPGQRLGLPETGPGSLATTGKRVLAFVVDNIAAALVATLFVEAIRHGHHHVAASKDSLPSPWNDLTPAWSLIPLAIDYVLGLLLAGRTLGMYLFGLRVIRVDADEPVTPWRALLRTFLLMLLIPAVVWDRDGRGLHDRYTDTAVVRG